MSFDSSKQCDAATPATGNAACFAARTDATGTNVIATTCNHVVADERGVCQCSANDACSTTFEPICRSGDLAGPVDAVVGDAGATCQVKTKCESLNKPIYKFCYKINFQLNMLFLLMQCNVDTCTWAGTAMLGNMCNAAGACVCGANGANNNNADADGFCTAGAAHPQCLDANGAEPAIELVADNNAAATCKV